MDRVVKKPNGDIDVERSSLGVVLQAEAGGSARCPICQQVPFLGPHAWDCPKHKRFKLNLEDREA